MGSDQDIKVRGKRLSVDHAAQSHNIKSMVHVSGIGTENISESTRQLTFGGTVAVRNQAHGLLGLRPIDRFDRAKDWSFSARPGYLERQSLSPSRLIAPSSAGSRDAKALQT